MKPLATAVLVPACRSMANRPNTRGFSSVPTGNKVSIEVAKKMPKCYEELSNEALCIMASFGDQEAREERLIREIMSVENVTWANAQPKFEEMSRANKEGMWLATLPYKIGIGMGVTAAVASIPLVFELNTVLWFNEHFVTSDVPEEKDLETWLEVGSWAWNWMEPPLGQISFFLLCLQFTRSQMQNIHLRPYTAWLQDRRARNLTSRYPQFNKIIVEDFAKGDKFHHH